MRRSLSGVEGRLRSDSFLSQRNGWLTLRAVEAVANIETTVNGTKPAVAKIETAVAGTKNAVANIEKTVNGTKPAVANIEATVAGTKNAVAKIETAVAGTKNAVANIEETVDRTNIAGRNNKNAVFIRLLLRGNSVLSFGCQLFNAGWPSNSRGLKRNHIFTFLNSSPLISFNCELPVPKADLTYFFTSNAISTSPVVG